MHFTNGFIAGDFALSVFLNNNIETTLISKTLPKNQDIEIFITIPNTSKYLPFELLAKQYIKNIIESKNYYEDILNDQNKKINIYRYK